MSLKQQSTGNTLIIAIGVLVFFFFSASEAVAQQDMSNATDAQKLQLVEKLCTQQPNHEICTKVRTKCISKTYEFLGDDDKRVCQNLGWTREQLTRKTIRNFKENCDGSDLDAECNTLRKSCREDTLTCEVAQDIACKTPGSANCDLQYLCAPSSLKSMCAGKSEAGAEHMFIHANYTSIQDTPVGADEFQSAIYSLSALTHGQTGDGSMSSSYVVDMGLGWIRGTDNNGLAYELQALIGAGLRHNEKFMVGAAVGGGFSGIISGDLGFGWLVSTELYAAVEVGGGIDLLGFVRPTWVFSEDARGDGSETLGFADELKVGGTVTWESKRDEGRFVHGSGYGLSLFMQEQLGVRMFGIGIGMSSSDASRAR